MDFGGQCQMSVLQKINRSQAFLEYQKNTRLQWMVMLIVAILALSGLKQFADQLQVQRNQTQNQLNLLARLQKTADNTLDSKTSETIIDSYTNWVSVLPDAPSSSVAEAQALAEIEQTIGKLISRKRLNLLGSETLNNNNQLYWQVRIEIAGQLPELDLIEALEYFDLDNKHARIASFQYSPKASNSISFVVDLLYKRADNA